MWMDSPYRISIGGLFIVLTEITTVLTQVAQWFVSLFQSLTSVFVTESSGTYTITFVGYFLLIALGVFLCSIILNWIKGLVRI